MDSTCSLLGESGAAPLPWMAWQVSGPREQSRDDLCACLPTCFLIHPSIHLWLCSDRDAALVLLHLGEEKEEGGRRLEELPPGAPQGQESGAGSLLPPALCGEGAAPLRLKAGTVVSPFFYAWLK